MVLSLMFYKNALPVVLYSLEKNGRVRTIDVHRLFAVGVEISTYPAKKPCNGVTCVCTKYATAPGIETVPNKYLYAWYCGRG